MAGPADGSCTRSRRQREAIAEIAKALDRSGSSRTPAVSGGKVAGRRELEAAGVPMVHFPVNSFRSSGAVSGAFALARYVRRHEIRLVHTFDYPATVFAVPAGRFLHRRRLFRANVPIAIWSRRLSPLGRMTDLMVDAIVVNCDFVRRHLQQDERVPASRIQLCYNGIDLDAFRPLGCSQAAGTRRAILW